MASKASLFVILVSMLFLANLVMSTMEDMDTESTAKPVTIAGPTNGPFQVCEQKCEARCKNHRKIRPCMKPCTKCCRQSGQCVPPGTSGNEQMCSKWTSVLIHGVPTKCP